MEEKISVNNYMRQEFGVMLSMTRKGRDDQAMRVLTEKIHDWASPLEKSRADSLTAVEPQFHL